MNIRYKLRWVFLAIAIQASGFALCGQEPTVTPNENNPPSDKASEVTKAATDEMLSTMTGWWFGNHRLIKNDVPNSNPLTGDLALLRLEIRGVDNKPTEFTAQIKDTRAGYTPRYHQAFALDWDTEANQLSGEIPVPKSIFGPDADGKIGIRITPGEAPSELNCKVVLDPAAKKTFEQALRKRGYGDQSAKLLEDPIALTFSRIFPGRKITKNQTMIVETLSGLAVMSKTNGNWSHVTIPLLNNGNTRLDQVLCNENFVLVNTDDALYSTWIANGLWGELKIPPEHRGKVKTEFGLDILTATIGSKLYLYSAATRRWTSPDDNAGKSLALSGRGGLAGPGVGVVEDRPLAGTAESKAPLANMARAGRGGGLRPAQQLGQPQTEDRIAAVASLPASSKTLRNIGLTLIETSDGLAAFSDKLGKWDRVMVKPRSDGRGRLEGAVVGTRAAAVVVNNGLFGFQADHGRWVEFEIAEEYVGKINGPTVGVGVVAAKIGRDVLAINGQSSQWSRLTIPDNLVDKTAYTVGTDSVDLVVGDKFYKLSSTTGEWTSPDDGPRNRSNGFEGRPGELIDPPVRQNPYAAGSVAIIDLTQKIKQLESQAVLHANQVRALSQQQGSDNAQVVEAKNELKRKLDEALELRFQREQTRIHELRSQLGRLEQQVGQRKAQRAAIVERRATELLEGDSLRWEGAEEPLNEGASNVSDVKSNSAVTNPNAVSGTAASPPTAIELLLRNKEARPGATGNTALELVRAQASPTPSNVPNLVPSPLEKRVQQAIVELTGTQKLRAQVQKKLDEKKQELLAAEKLGVSSTATDTSKKTRAEVKSLESQLREVKSRETMSLRNLHTLRTNLALLVTSTELDLSESQATGGAKEQTSATKEVDAEQKTNPLNLRIEYLKKQIELIDELDAKSVEPDENAVRS